MAQREAGPGRGGPRLWLLAEGRQTPCIGPLLSVDEELLRRGIDETYDMGIDFDYSEEIDGI